MYVALSKNFDDIFLKWKKQYRDQIRALNDLTKIKGNYKNLLKIIIVNLIFLLHSYEQIKRKKSYFKGKFFRKRLNAFSFKWIEKIFLELKQGIYVFKIRKKKSIFKLDFKQNKELITINFLDKIVQKVIRIVLNKIYKNILKKFHNGSHRFCLGKSCHKALKEIKYTWMAISWFLEFNIKKVFDKINRNRLCSIFKKNI